MFKNDYVPMPFIKYNFIDVMDTYKQYININGLNFFNSKGRLTFKNILETMKYIDDNVNPANLIYSSFDFVNIRDGRAFSTKYYKNKRLINNEDIYRIIYEKSGFSVSDHYFNRYNHFIICCCGDYMLLIDWMFNNYMRIPGLNMRFDYNFSFIPLIKTIYRTINKYNLYDYLYVYERSSLFNSQPYYSNQQFLWA